jgi:L-threonylcarbamoyladenylate synthase
MILKYAPADQDKICTTAARMLARGELIVYPTDTFYALGADATNPGAVRQVYKLKKSPLDQPLPILVASYDMLLRWARTGLEQERILRARLPGRYTFMLQPRKPLPVPAGSIGFRFPDHWCAKIADSLGRPITATPANIHNQPVPATIEEVKKIFGTRVALYIDQGPLAGKPPTVMDITSFPPRILPQE